MHKFVCDKSNDMNIIFYVFFLYQAKRYYDTIINVYSDIKVMVCNGLFLHFTFKLRKIFSFKLNIIFFPFDFGWKYDLDIKLMGLVR